MPGLPAVDHPQRPVVERLFGKIDRPGESVVLLDPSVLDRLKGDFEHAFGEHAKRKVQFFLRLDDLKDLLLIEHALLDEDLADADGLIIGVLWQSETPEAGGRWPRESIGLFLGRVYGGVV